MLHRFSPTFPHHTPRRVAPTTPLSTARTHPRPPARLHSVRVHTPSHHYTYVSPYFQDPHDSSFYCTFAPETPCSPPFTSRTRPLSAHVTSHTYLDDTYNLTYAPKTPSSPRFALHMHPLTSCHCLSDSSCTSPGLRVCPQIPGCFLMSSVRR